MVALLILLIAVSFVCLVAPPAIRMVTMRSKIQRAARVPVMPLG